MKSQLLTWMIVIALCTLVRAGALPTRGTMNGVAYGSGVWVIAGANGHLFTSLDGVSWTQRDSGVSVTFFGACYCPELDTFTAVGADMGIVWSRDHGETWVVVNPPRSGTATLKSVACKGKQVVAVTQGGSALQSSNGVLWEIIDSGIVGEMLYSIRSINDMFYATGNGKIFASQNATNFKTVMNSGHSAMYDLAGVNVAEGLVFGIVSTPLFMISVNGFERTTGVLRVPNEELVVATCAFRNTFAVAATDGVYLGDSSLQIYKLVATGGRFWGIGAGGEEGGALVAVGDSGGSSYVAYSPDGGNTWV